MNREELIGKILTTLCESKPEKLTDYFNSNFKGLFVVLKILDNANRPLTAGEVSEYLNISTARVAVVLNKLEESKYIEKHKDEMDGRKTIVKLTETGKNFLGQKNFEFFEIAKNIFEKLTEEELMQLLRIIEKLI